MQYMGGKARIARHLVAAIREDSKADALWVEPFVGGGNVMEHAAPFFRRAYGFDTHPDLILLWQYMAAGGVLPEVTRETYNELRHADPSWFRGFVGFGASFGGKWFGGYGVSPRDGELWKQSHRTVTRQGAAFRRYGVFFDRADYSILRPPAGSVVYCDPPYAGTTSYATGPFDHEGFYKVLRGWAADCFVYVSEYSIPSTVDHEVVWQRERRTSLKSDVNVEVRMEKLFRVAP